ncbi:MAG: lipid kinase [Rhizobiales bacterium PAR1]|nr:MAG: lipid kinase [Rhizobiales bacterium PAR1]
MTNFTGAPRPPRRILLIGNANSRRGQTLEAATAVFEQRGIAVQAMHSHSRNAMTSLIHEHATGMDAVVVAGGDGTINSVAPALIETALPLGILPMGTANDLARTLHLPTRLEAAADIIAQGKQRQIDLGWVNGHPFFNVASIGLSAELAAGLTPRSKRWFGRLAYTFTALNVLIRARTFGAAIVTDRTVRRVKTLQIAVGNGKYYGGGMAIEADACISDGTLDLYSLEFRRIWKLLLMARAFREGSHGLWQEVRTERATTFEIRTRKPRPVNTDGELITFTPARFEIRPKSVVVFVP